MKRSKEKNAFTFQQVLMNRESDYIGLDLYKFDPEYSVEKINSRQHFIPEITARPPLFSVRHNHFRTFSTHLHYCFEFLQKMYM